MEPRAVIVSGCGINADAELAEAFRRCGAAPDRVHVADLAAEPGRLSGARILAFPGGFSFGDHLGSGQVLALLCRRSLRGPLDDFIADGGLVIGICNGFQALARMGLLPGRPGEPWARSVSLVHNASGRFVDEWVPVRFEERSACLWTAGLPPCELPVRHGEGRFAAAGEEALDSLEAEGLVALRYATRPDGSSGNPNGSARDIAGVCDPTGRVLGLMPHPEAWLERENHPLRRRAIPGWPSSPGAATPGVATPGVTTPGVTTPGLELIANGVRAARSGS